MQNVVALKGRNLNSVVCLISYLDRQVFVVQYQLSKYPISVHPYVAQQSSIIEHHWYWTFQRCMRTCVVELLVSGNSTAEAPPLWRPHTVACFNIPEIVCLFAVSNSSMCIIRMYMSYVIN